MQNNDTHTDRRAARNSPDTNTDAESDSSFLNRLATPSIVATGSITFTAVLVIAGLLWAGTGLNVGIQAPSAVAVPTVWAAAFVGAAILTTVLSFLGFAFAYTGGTNPRDPPSGPPKREINTGKTTTDNNPQNGRKGTQTVDVTGKGRSPARPKGPNDPSVQRRVDDNYPDHLTQSNSQKNQNTNDAHQGRNQRQTTADSTRNSSASTSNSDTNSTVVDNTEKNQKKSQTNEGPKKP